MAAASGTVVSTGYEGAYGNQVIIDHGDGYQTTYNHLSGIGVSVGDKVSTGDQIGKRGSTGQLDGCAPALRGHEGRQVRRPRGLAGLVADTQCDDLATRCDSGRDHRP